MSTPLVEPSTTPWSGTLLAAVCLVLLVLGPAVAWGLRVTSRGRSGAPVVASGLAVGTTTWVLVASLLVRTGHLGAVETWVATLLVTAASGAVAVRALRHRPGRHRRTSAARPERRALRDRPGARGVLAVALTLLAVAAPALVGLVQRPYTLASPTPWYYWLTTRGVALDGGVPAHVVEWGQQSEAFTLHYGFTSATAMLAVASGHPGSLLAAQVVRVFALLTFSAGAWLVCRSLGATTVGACAGAAAASSLSIFAAKLNSYRPESTAYGLALVVVALFVWALRHGDRATRWASVVGVVGLFQLHGLTALVAVAMMGGASAAHLAAVRTRPDLLARLRRLASYAVACGVAIAVSGLLITGSVTEASEVSGVPDVADGLDPTWAFNTLVSGSTHVGVPGAGAPTNAELARMSLSASLLGLPDWVFWALCALTAVAAVLLAVRRADARGVLLFGVVTALLVGASALLISSLGETYVPRRTGFTRVLQLWPLVPVVVAAALSGPAALVLRQRARLAVPATGVLLGLLLWGAQAGPTLALASGGPDAPQLRHVQALDVRPGALVLTNAYTQGFVQLQTAGVGLLDGQAPYQDAALLERSNRILVRTRDYFRSPRVHPFPFERYGVEYVLAARTPWALGTPANFFPSNTDRLDDDPRLRRVSADGDLVLYEVRG